MPVFQIESIEYEFNPDIFENNKNDDYSVTKWNRHHKKRHHRSQHPSTYITPWNYIYNTNSSDTLHHTYGLNVGHPCSYVPMLMLTHLGILICLFATIYSFCIASNPKSHKDTEIYINAV
jgi:hypothetical protein